MSNALLRPALLAALAGGPQHGYGLLRTVESITAGQISPAVGSLYRVIDALARDGLIEIDHEETVDGRLRRYYRLSESGRAELALVTDTVSRMAAHVRAQAEPSKPVGSTAALTFGAAV